MNPLKIFVSFVLKCILLSMVSKCQYQSTCPSQVTGCSVHNQCTECANSLCGYCQNTDGTICGDQDCMTCIDGYKLNVVYSDGTGQCVSNTSFYECVYNSGEIDIKDLTSDPYFMSFDQAQQIAETAKTIGRIGIDIQDNAILISLLFVNVIASIFIIIGLYLYEEKIKFKHINIHYVVVIIILLQILLITSIHISEYLRLIECIIHIGNYSIFDTLTWVDLTQYILCTILCFIFCKYSFHGKCAYFKYFVGVFTIILPIFIGFMMEYGFEVVRQLGGYAVYALSQILIMIIWCFLVINNFIPCNYNKCTSLLSKCKRFNGCTRQSMLLWTFIFCGIFGLHAYFMIKLAITDTDVGAVSCFQFGGGYLWYNPFFMIISICLLFSDAKLPVLLYHIILGIIASFDLVDPNMCAFIINIPYIIHSLFVPIYIVVIFFTIKELKDWKFDLISIYLVAFDVFTDIVVVFYFIESGDYIFAALQISFILMGQIFGSFAGNFSDNYDNLTAKDKILSLFGFAQPWFLINSWSETNGNATYLKLNNKHKIWDLMFESFPTVTLQIYAALVIDEISIFIIISIFISSVSISFNVLLYLIKLIHQDRQIKHKNNTYDSIELVTKSKPIDEESTFNRLPTMINRKFGKVLDNKSLYLHLYSFMVSDFYIRSVPLVIFISSVPCSHNLDEGDTICNNRTITGCILFACLLIFEFIMNRRIRRDGYKLFGFIIQIFPVSILSSFYTLLSSLDILENDKFFGKSVIFKSYLFEHKIRVCLSIIFNIINILLITIYALERYIIFILIVVYAVFLILNYYALKYIKVHIEKKDEEMSPMTNNVDGLELDADNLDVEEMCVPVAQSINIDRDESSS